jgi:hypothetical protein
MRKRRYLTIAGIMVMAVSLASAFSISTLFNDEGTGNFLGGISLSAPAVSAETANFLESEAGIAGYGKVSWDASTNSTTWNNIKDQLQTTEKEGDDYIVGTLAMTDYSTRWDPHVYIDKDGWVVIYWPRDETRSILLDIKAGFGKTMVERAISSIASSGGQASPPISYYDFANPTANRILVASLPVTTNGDATFSVTIPPGIALLAAGWVFWDTSGVGCHNHYNRLPFGSTQLTCGYPKDTVRNVSIPKIGSLSPPQIPVNTETFFTVDQRNGTDTRTSIMLVLREN